MRVARHIQAGWLSPAIALAIAVGVAGSTIAGEPCLWGPDSEPSPTPAAPTAGLPTVPGNLRYPAHYYDPALQAPSRCHPCRGPYHPCHDRPRWGEPCDCHPCRTTGDACLKPKIWTFRQFFGELGREAVHGVNDPCWTWDPDCCHYDCGRKRSFGLASLFWWRKKKCCQPCTPQPGAVISDQAIEYGAVHGEAFDGGTPYIPQEGVEIEQSAAPAKPAAAKQTAKKPEKKKSGVLHSILRRW